VPTSKRPQINDVQYPRIPSKVLKGVLSMMKKSFIVVEMNDDEACEIMLIWNVWSVETPKYPAGCKESGRATRGMPTSGRSQNTSAQAPRSTW
jgi:hypothetical protein